MTRAPDDTRQRLLNAAGPLFAEKGLRATTIRDICEAAGVNVAAVNYHFRDKEQFYVELVHYAGQECMRQVPLPQWAPGTPPEQKLADFITMLLNRVAVDRDPPWAPQLVMREMIFPTAVCADFVREYVRPQFLVLSGVLQELLPHVPDEKRRLIGFSIVGQCLHYRFGRAMVTLLVGEEAFRRSFDVDHLAEHITRFSLDAIRALARQPEGTARAAPGRKS